MSRHGAAGVQAVYAGMWRRGWASVIDVFMWLLLWMLIAATTHGHRAGAITWLAVIVYQVGLTVEGGTFGKRIMSLRVVRSDGSGVDLWRAFVREVVGKPISVFAGMLGVVWALDDRRRQGWHDKMADTVVVREVRTDEGPPWRFDPPWVKGSAVPLAPPTVAEPPLDLEPVEAPPAGEPSAGAVEAQRASGDESPGADDEPPAGR